MTAKIRVMKSIVVIKNSTITFFQKYLAIIFKHKNKVQEIVPQIKWPAIQRPNALT
jgi:hypothetical protein